MERNAGKITFNVYIEFNKVRISYVYAFKDRTYFVAGRIWRLAGYFSPPVSGNTTDKKETFRYNNCLQPHKFLKLPM